MNAFTYTHRFSARLFAILAVFSLLMSLFPVQAFATQQIKCDKDFHLEGEICVADVNPNVTLCHATESAQNPYNLITTDAKSIVNLPNGHDDHVDGGLDDEGDIIPPFDYNFGNGLQHYGGSQNWNDAGAHTIWENDCEVVTPDPTGTIVVEKVLVNEPEDVTADDFHFTINDGDSVKFESDGSNSIADQEAGSYMIAEVEADGTGYTTTYSEGCDDGELKAEKTLTCTITNTYSEVVDMCPNLDGGPYEEIPLGYHKNNDGMCVPDENPQYADVTLCKVGGTGVPMKDWELFLAKGDDTFKNGLTATETGCLTINHVLYGTYTVDETMKGPFWENVEAEGFTAKGASVTIDSPTETFTLKNKEVEHCSGEKALNNGERGECQYPEEGNEVVTACKYQVWEGEEGSDSLAGWVMTITNDEGNVTIHATTTEEGKGCVSVEVDPEDGPFYVYEEMPGDWTQNDVSVTGGTVEDGEGGKYCTFFPEETWTEMAKNTITGLISGDVVEDEDEDTYRCDFYNMEDEEEVPQCTNLLVNGSFEDPIVTTNGGTWGLFGTVAGWVIDTMDPNFNDELELWANGFYGGASDGNQNAELDGNAPTKISQNVLTTPGATYELKFDFSARPDADSAADNSIDALIDGAAIMNATADGSDIGTNTWSTHSQTFVAASSTTNVAFEDKGTANSLGSLMDNARLCLVREPEPVEACSITMISDTTNTVDGNPAVATWVHPAWIQQLTGSAAQWIWGTQYVVDASATTTETFTKTFTWNGPVTSAILDVAADNSYSVKVNGVTFGGDASGDNFSAADQHNMTAFMQANIVSGNNTLEITVTNSAYNTTDPQTNPAGLLYNLMLVGDTQTDCKKQPGGGDNGGNDGLTCQLTANDTSVKRGTDVTLNWTTTGASAASIDQGIGSVATTSGSTVVNELNDDTTFTMTVMDSSEKETTCSVSIDTTTGGGGGGGHRRNRDGDVEGDSDSRPEGQVLGDQVSVVPLGAADAGAGGTSPMVIPTAQLTAVALLGRTRK